MDIAFVYAGFGEFGGGWGVDRVFRRTWEGIPQGLKPATLVGGSGCLQAIVRSGEGALCPD